MGQNYDAILFLSFGGPEGTDDVMPFLENVLRGKNVPRERMEQVAQHYYLFGGISPINQQNRKLISALKDLFEKENCNLPIYFGNRNWHPLLTDTMREMKDDGVKHALAFVTSAYSSYSGCRQYLEDMERARAMIEDAPRVDKIRAYYNHEGFIKPNIENVKTALEQIPFERRDKTELVFTAHSIPSVMAATCDYQVQLEEACRLVAESLNHKNYKLVFQSRSGLPQQAWLEPDICDYLKELKSKGAKDVVVHPIGFISDHLEVVYDLDILAKKLSEEIGLNMIRSATVGTHPDFVKMIYELVQERIAENHKRKFLGTRGACTDVCVVDCCTYTPTRPQTRYTVHGHRLRFSLL
jgi:ferrochelatase